ncbi:MAG TPA: DUF2842 domain-containing protein [Afifellaceae bacterium]|nr:DUF2842 domain-containing protein [Afifellaceae bacterium]
MRQRQGREGATSARAAPALRLPYKAAMRQRVRKLVGTIALLAFIGLYALLVMALAASRLAELSGPAQLVFYAVAGLLWVLPAGLIVSWMQRPDPPPPDER